MRSIPTTLCSSFAVMSLGLAACGAGATSSPGSSTTGGPSYTVASAEEWASLQEAGKASFDRACGACHPGGEADLGPRLSELGWDTGHMYAQIREGSRRMKPIAEARLPEVEMKGLIVYLASLGAVSDLTKP